MSVGQNIRRLRKEAHLTQEQLAQELNVARSTVTQWERGWSEPRMGKVVKLAEVLGTTPSAIVTNPSNPQATELQAEDPAPISASAPMTLEYLSQEPTVPIAAIGRLRDGESSGQGDAADRMPVPVSLFANHPNARSALVEDDSMDRVAPKGSAVVYDPDLEPANGNMVIVEMQDHETLLRRWYRGGNTLMLVADSHTAHDDIVLSGDAPVGLVGTVVWIQSPRELA